MGLVGNLANRSARPIKDAIAIVVAGRSGLRSSIYRTELELTLKLGSQPYESYPVRETGSRSNSLLARNDRGVPIQTVESQTHCP